MRNSPPASTPWRARLLHLLDQRWFRWSRDLLLLAIFLVGVAIWQTRGHLVAGSPVATATFRTLDGQPVQLASFRGRPTALAFWAPWCSICKLESRNLSWAARLAGDRGRVVSVAASFDDVREVRAYMAEQGVDYPVLLGDEQALRDFRVDAFPTVYLLDAEGRVTGSVTGYTTTVGLLARLLL
jgi:thiol-disulfide isomerase/thioredoxin